MTETLSQTLAAYKAWLDRQPLATKTRMAYRLQVHQYGAYLALRSPTADDPLYTLLASENVSRSIWMTCAFPHARAQ
jgi:hypothetical protein